MNDNYKATLLNLFDLLVLANSADSNHVEEWQKTWDTNQRHGFYGSIRQAIIDIAGTDIIYHWEETGEIELMLASRKY